MMVMMMMMMMMMTSPDKDLDGEPGVADALDIEEGVVGVGAVLVQRPVGDVTTSRRHCDVPGSFNEADDDDDNEKVVSLPYHGNSHVRVGLQAEGEDGDADEEHRDHSDHLNFKIIPHENGL